MEGKVGSKTTTKWKGDEFVFAFRVSKVFVGQATGQVVSEEDYYEGAMFGDEERHVKGPELIITKVEEPDLDDEGFNMEELMEDDDVVACAIQKRETLVDW
jgi:hypothetical protein